MAKVALCFVYRRYVYRWKHTILDSSNIRKLISVDGAIIRPGTGSLELWKLSIIRSRSLTFTPKT